MEVAVASAVLVGLVVFFDGGAAAAVAIIRKGGQTHT